METSKRGGPGRGQGRKAKQGGARSVSLTLRITPDQKIKYDQLGGVDWFRRTLDNESESNSESKPDSKPAPHPQPKPKIDIPPAMAWAIKDMRDSRQPHELIDIPDQEALQEAILHFAAVQAEVDAANSSGSATAIFEARAKLQEASRALKKANGIIEPEDTSWKPNPKLEGNLFTD